MLTRINRWFGGPASVLAVSALCSCNSTYSPVESNRSIQEMSADDARTLVRNMASYVRCVTKDTVDPSGSGIPLTDGRFAIAIAAVQVTRSRVIMNLNGGRVIEVPLKELNPTDFCAPMYPHGYCDIYLGDKNSILLFQNNSDVNVANRLTDALVKLKHVALSSGSPENDARFAEALRMYRAATTKPPLPEEVRRVRVQAEGAIRDKDFGAAADLYEQGLAIVPWWPEGHFNRALVLAETGEFPDAIAEMKRYLALVPEAPDARAAQDKIYDWERRVSH